MAKKTALFKKGLGVFDSTALVAGSMIGSGIFIVSADMSRILGSPGALLLAWLVTGLITLTAALSYGELAGMMPQAGGQYVYLREAYGPLVGFLYGWALFLVVQTGTIAAVAVAFAKFTGVLIPFFSETHILLTMGKFHVSAAQLLAVAVIAGLTAWNMRGLTQGKLLQNTFTVAKIGGILVLLAAGIFAGVNAKALSANWGAGFWVRSVLPGAPGMPEAGVSVLALFGVAMVGSLFSSDAWNNITFIAGEVREPKRTIPLSLALGTLLVTGLYLLMNAVYLLVLPIHGDPMGADALARGIQFAASDRVGTAVASAIWGHGGEIAMALLIMVSTFGCNNGLILSGARVYRTLAMDGLFFPWAKPLSARGVPAAALIGQAVWASALCLSGTYGDLLDYVVFVVLVFYILTVGGLFVLRRTKPKADRPYRAWGYPVLPAAYILVAGAICVNLLIMKPSFTFAGLVIVASGLPAYWIWKRQRA